MNIFCRLFGHTWVHKCDDPEIVKTASESQHEMELTAKSEPVFYHQCARCGERREAVGTAPAA